MLPIHPHPTPDPELNAVLHELVTGMQTCLGSTFIAACLQGSFAVGDWDAHSDVDFVVAVADEISHQQVQALQALHERIFNLPSPWAQHLEGSYFPQAILRDYTQTGKLLWYLDNGSRSLEQSEHCNSIVVRWTVRQHGVPLAGPNPAALVDPIPVEALRQDIRSTLTDWGGQILADPEQYNNRFYQGFIVLSYCRMLHDLVYGCTSSKRASAGWAKANLDPGWADLIDRAWACRPVPEVSVRAPANPEDFQRTLEFIRYIIAESRNIA